MWKITDLVFEKEESKEEGVEISTKEGEIDKYSTREEDHQWHC